jgi:tRNA U34 2-thiouridine synthase MnmA/TrmU
MKKIIPWVLGLAAVGGGGYWYWLHKMTGTKGVTVAQVTDTITKLIAMDDASATVKITPKEKSDLIVQFDHGNKAKLVDVVNKLKARGYTNLANAFATQSVQKYGA